MYIGNVFKGKKPATATCDSHYCTCLGHLGWYNIGSFIFFVAPPKVAKASTVMHFCCWHYPTNFGQWIHSLMEHTTCIVVMIILLVSAANILTVKAGTSIHPAYLPALSAPPAYLHLLLALFFCCKLICFEQSTFRRYLWFQAFLSSKVVTWD